LFWFANTMMDFAYGQANTPIVRLLLHRGKMGMAI
jgi:hypothetical protein